MGATEYKTISAGHWSHPSTWLSGLVPGSTIGLTDTVIIEHDVFYNLGQDPTLYGTLEVRGDLNGRVVLTVQSGKSLYIEGAAAHFRLINAGFNNTGAPPSGNASLYNTNGNLYAFNSFIELARFMVNSGATSEYRNTCVSIGRDFTSTSSTEQIINSTISLGLNTKGGFEFTNGILTCQNARVEVLSKKDGFFKLNSGSISGNFNAISVQTSNGSIIINSSVTGKAVLETYCLNGGSLFNGGGFTVLPNANDCSVAASYFPCSSFTQGFSFNDGYVVMPENGVVTVGIIPYLYDLGYILNPGAMETTDLTPPQNGSVLYDVSTSSFTYTPDPGFSGVDSFTYVICDDLPFYDICDTAVVTIIVTPQSSQAVGTQPDTILFGYQFNGDLGESWPDAVADGWTGFQTEQVSDPNGTYFPNNDFLGLKYSEYNTLGSWIESPPIDFGGLKSLAISFSADGAGSITVFIKDSLNQYQLEHIELPDGFGGSYTTLVSIFINNPWVFDPSYNPQISGKTTILIEYNNEDGSESARIYDFMFEGEAGTIWLGDHSQDWFNDPDWTNGVPNRKKSGLVPAGRPNYPRIVGEAISKGLVVEDRALIVVKPLGSLTTYDTAYVNGQYAICLYADSTGTGAFIPRKGFRGSGTAYIEQWLNADMWHHISAPIDAGMSMTYLSIYLLPWNESMNSWGSYIVPLDVPLPVMRGYAAWSSSTWPAMGDTVVWFGGHMNFDSYSIEVVNSAHSGNSELDGWNLVGNPYTCSIHWDSLGWNKNAVESAIYLWDPATQGYRTYMGNGIGIPMGTTGEIPQGQGFFVKAKAGAGAFGVGPRARMLPTASLYKSAGSLSDPQDNLLYLTVEGQGYSDQALLRWIEGVSPGFKSNLDAYKLFGANASAPQLYIHNGATDTISLAISSIGAVDSVIVIPIGLRPGAGGNYRLGFSPVESFLPNSEYYLEDLKLDTLVQITGSSFYSFTSAGTDAEDRFLLHIVPASLQGHVTYHSNPSIVFPGVEVNMSDVTGKLMKSTTSGLDGAYRIMGMVDGSYQLQAGSIGEAWSGANATDALNVCRHFLGIANLDPLSARAADVDNSGYVNTADALMISRRFVGLISSFQGGDWISEARTVQISGAGSYTADPNVICVGDVDCSYGISNTKMGAIPLASERTVLENMIFGRGLPILAATTAQLGAVSLSLQLPADAIVAEIVMAAGHGELLYHQDGNRLTISWFSLQAFEVQTGGEILRIRFDRASVTEDGFEVKVIEPSEVATPDGKALAGFDLLIPSLSTDEETTMTIFPNPGDGRFSFSISGFVTGEAIFEVLDVKGSQMVVWTQELGEGTTLIGKDLSYLTAGKYIIRISDPQGKMKEHTQVLLISR